MIERIVIIGTGLIGASVGLALRQAGFVGSISGFDASGAELAAALENGAIDTVLHSRAETLAACESADLIVLAVPVLAILDWMHLLAPVLKLGQLVTDVGSTKLQITEAATRLFAGKQSATFLPGHPMAGKESGGAALAEATLFQNAMWLFTPPTNHEPSAIEQEWRTWVAKFGARTLNLDAAHHDELCAWVSHLPQMLSTALAALLEDTFGNDPARRAEIDAIGGRALREMTRLGASPYSMWRDVALSNTDPVAATLLALEQRLQHIRENLKTPELREEFLLANKFREAR
ncbi:prephenate dehydrogenase [Granulicella aggregans]|uniref:prephenate dehydrogenase n=1 Tax=Granulicella aggregans TaxID=474949 RepID=UPI0021E0FA6E|nr:prephenate dehydrogenase [Granulicella aggregans]